MASRLAPDDLPLPRSPVVAIVIAACTIAVIGRLDYATGSETSVVVLYLLPVALVAWTAGPVWAVLAALLCAALSLTSDLLVIETFRNPLVPYWNAAAQFSVFALFGLVLAALRSSIQRERIASHLDYLTGVANWRAFAEAAETELARTRRFGHPLTLVYTDCDDFKQVNDTKGHTEGDRILRLIAGALHETTREVDTVARLGGDEFVVLLPETGPDSDQRAVARMQDVVRRRMTEAGTGVTISIGSATFLRPPESLDELVRVADRMLYAAKSEGGDRAVRATED